MHQYTKDAIAGAARSCETALQLAHIFGHAEAAVGAYHIEKAEKESAHAFRLAENYAPARARWAAEYREARKVRVFAGLCRDAGKISQLLSIEFRVPSPAYDAAGRCGPGIIWTGDRLRPAGLWL